MNSDSTISDQLDSESSDDGGDASDVDAKCNADDDELLQCDVCHSEIHAIHGNHWIWYTTCIDIHVCINR